MANARRSGDFVRLQIAQSTTGQPTGNFRWFNLLNIQNMGLAPTTEEESTSIDGIGFTHYVVETPEEILGIAS